MRIEVNGQTRDVRPETTIRELVQATGVQTERGVAVALDGEVVPQGAWPATVVREGQKVEVLQAIQGG